MKHNFVWIDVLRLILALLVVCVHVPCALNAWISWLISLAVPGFLVISGFLMWQKPVESYNRALKKVGSTTIVAFLLYLPVYLLLYTQPDWHEGSSWLNMLLFNQPVGSEHLWYLLCYLYVLVIMRPVHAWLERKPLTLLFLFLILAVGNAAMHSMGLELYWWRNWLFTGLPCYALGLYLRNRYEQQGCSFLSSGKRWVQRVASWGARYTLDIYILHPLIYVGCGYTLCYFFLFRAAMWWFGPLVIFLLTWAVSVLCRHFVSHNRPLGS